MYNNVKQVVQGFTLTELLVVVLIIGILAAIVLPQYNKAVEKGRATEAIMVLNTLQKGIDAYVLENGFPAEGTLINFLGEADFHEEGVLSVNTDLNIGIPHLLFDKDIDGMGYGYSQDFSYYAFCFSFYCRVHASRGSHAEKEEQQPLSPSDYIDGKYSLNKEIEPGRSEWSKRCYGNCPANIVW